MHVTTSREARVHARYGVMFQHSWNKHRLQIVLHSFHYCVVYVDTLVGEEGPVVGQIVVLESKLPHSGR